MYQSKDELVRSYEKSFKQFGDSAEGANMQLVEQQYRFSQAFKILSWFLESSPQKEISVLDVGCGLGHLYDYLAKKLDIKVNYTGIEIVEEYAIHAKKERKLDVFVHDLLESNLDTSYDYVFGLAILSRKTRENHLEHMIDRMAYHAKKGVIFDCNSTLNYIGSFEKYEPNEVMRLCSVISKKFILSHDPTIKNMYIGLDTTNAGWRIGQGGAK